MLISIGLAVALMMMAPVSGGSYSPAIRWPGCASTRVARTVLTREAPMANRTISGRYGSEARTHQGPGGRHFGHALLAILEATPAAADAACAGRSPNLPTRAPPAAGSRVAPDPRRSPRPVRRDRDGTRLHHVHQRVGLRGRRCSNRPSVSALAPSSRPGTMWTSPSSQVLSELDRRDPQARLADVGGAGRADGLDPGRPSSRRSCP